MRREVEYVTVEERKAAFMVIVKNHQEVHVTSHMQRSMKNLNLQHDEKGLLRCCGRMDNAQIPELTKKPLFISAKTSLAVRIIREAHLPLHRGTSRTIATVRVRFWIPHLRQQEQATLRKCIACQRFNRLPFSYPAMGPLPSKRVVRAKPFEHSGIEYFGPLTTKRGQEC